MLTQGSSGREPTLGCELQAQAALALSTHWSAGLAMADIGRRQMDKWTGGWIRRWGDEWMDKWGGGWINEWMGVGQRRSDGWHGGRDGTYPGGITFEQRWRRRRTMTSRTGDASRQEEALHFASSELDRETEAVGVGCLASHPGGHWACDCRGCSTRGQGPHRPCVPCAGGPASDGTYHPRAALGWP